jgi:lipopolysaccharide transport system ATP-binding protein
MIAAITVKNLGKCYKVNHLRTGGGYRTIRESLSEAAGSAWDRLRGKGSGQTTEDFWALKDLDFAVQHGDVVGIIGRNGAGKSTLLKILSRITRPSTGHVEVRGRVGSLLEVGTGFHPELTGRENIYLNGAILGMPRTQIWARFDEVVDFAGVEKFLDTPVKRYSSGMYVRLAFAVAAYLETDVLLVDEVLAVGDSEFQKKCLGRMQDLSSCGRTVFFVSHNMPAVRSLTRRCLYLQDGRLLFDGPTPEAIDRYLGDAWARKAENDAKQLDYYRRDRSHPSPVQFRRVWITNAEGGSVNALSFREDFSINCEIESTDYRGEVLVAFWLTNQQGERVATFFSPDQGVRAELVPGRTIIAAAVSALPLSPGRYSLTIGVNQQTHTIAFDVLVDYPAFEVEMPGIGSGEREWPNRPWGCIHWENVAWSVSVGGQPSSRFRTPKPSCQSWSRGG